MGPHFLHKTDLRKAT